MLFKAHYNTRYSFQELLHTNVLCIVYTSLQDAFIVVIAHPSKAWNEDFQDYPGQN